MDYLRNYAPKFLRCLREHGFWRTARETIRVVVRDLSEWRLDRKWRVDTRGIKVHAREDPASPYRHAEMYEATTPRVFKKIMDSIRHLALPNTFIDMGCGKGRVLFMAADYGFTRVVGVELDFLLATIAMENVRRFESRHASRTEIKVLCQDAGTYQFPDEDAIIFLYHPFGEAVMRKVFENIRASACGRRARYIIYLNPVWKSLLSDPREFTLLVRAKTYSVYRMEFQEPRAQYRQ